MTSTEIRRLAFETTGRYDTIHVTIHGKRDLVTILDVHEFGTLDVETRDGICYRLTGLTDPKPFLSRTVGY